METVNRLLNLPDTASSSERALAVSELLKEQDSIQAARSAAESELAELRAETAELFADCVCAAHGIESDSVHDDLCEAWKKDPHSAIDGFLVIDDEEELEAANPYGCNQYGEGWKMPHNGISARRKYNKTDKKADKPTDEQKGKNLADALRKAQEQKKNKPQKQKQKEPETRKTQKEESEGSKHKNPLREAADKESSLYDKARDSSLSDTERKKAVKEWAKAHDAFWEKQLTMSRNNELNSTEATRETIRLEDRMSRHYEEMLELYPELVR